MTDLVSRLRQFDRTLAELRRASTLLAGVPDSMRALHDEHTAARAALEALEAAAEAAALDRRTAEAAIADAQEKLKHFQQQVSRVRNQREYGAILSEIDQAKTQLRSLEEAALAALDKAETTVRELETRREGFAELATRYDAEMVAWVAEKPSVAAEVARLEAAANELRGGLPKPVVVQFVRIVERYSGVAMAEVKRAERPGQSAIWHCGVCNFQIRPQVALEIRLRGAIVQCDGCRRFLYSEPAG
jgi:predicted  nucleic acid-binding Zn-ribbon protein